MMDIPFPAFRSIAGLPLYLFSRSVSSPYHVLCFCGCLTMDEWDVCMEKGPETGQEWAGRTMREKGALLCTSWMIGWCDIGCKRCLSGPTCLDRLNRCRLHDSPTNPIFWLSSPLLCLESVVTLVSDLATTGLLHAVPMLSSRHY
jgi:hypothetical protein